MSTTAVMELYGVSYVKETTAGETPSSPTMLELVQNSFTVRPERAKMESGRRLGDAQVVYNRLGRKRVAGDCELELSYVDQDDMLESLFGATFPTAFSEVSAATISFDLDTQTISDSNSGFGSVSAGDWIIVAGATNAANNGVFYVTTASSAALVVAMGATTLVTESAGASVTVNQELRIENGLTVDTYTFEGRHTDTDDYLRFKGVAIDTGGIEANDDIAVLRLGLIGLDFASSATSLGTPTPASNNAPMDSLGGAYQIDHTASRIRRISVDIQRNTYLSRPLGQNYGDEIFRGRCVVTGSMSRYFESKSDYDDFWAETHKHLKFTFIDPTGNYYTFHVYKALLTEVSRDEEDEAVLCTFSFDALRHPTNLKTIGVAKYAA